MTADAEHLGQHDPDHLGPLGHFDAGHFLYRHHIRQIVHHPAQVIDAVGIGDKSVPGLALGHLFGAAVVIADVRHRVYQNLAV